MQKLVAFDLYRKNEHGGHQRVFPSSVRTRSTEGREVYLASEADREISAITSQRDETAEKLKAADARIQALTFGSNR